MYPPGYHHCSYIVYTLNKLLFFQSKDFFDTLVIFTVVALRNLPFHDRSIEDQGKPTPKAIYRRA